MDYWSFLTLTYEQNGKHLSSKVFRDGLRCWDLFRKRVIRQYGKFAYIQTWEVTRKGWPHLHVAISNEFLWNAKAHSKKLRFNRYLGEISVASGFGPVGELDPIRDETAMAGYLCKTARELTGGGKGYQIPVNAPKNFRRLRASVRLLPPPHKDPDITGVLRMCTPQDDE